MPMPGTHIKKGIKPLVVVVVEILHEERRAGTVDDVFEVSCGGGVSRKLSASAQASGVRTYFMVVDPFYQ